MVSVLSAKNQRNEIMVWALVDDDDIDYHRILELTSIGTGWDIEESWFNERWFVDTVVLEPYVWHIWGRYYEN